MIKRILWMLAAGAVAIVGLLSVVGHTYYRSYRHRADFLASIEEVGASEKDERERLMEDVRDRLRRGDFDGLDALARELRASGATFANGTWKLTVLHDGLGGLSEESTDAQWGQALEQARRWTVERPRSITARVSAADLWRGYAWKGRGSGWSHEVTPSSGTSSTSGWRKRRA